MARESDKEAVNIKVECGNYVVRVESLRIYAEFKADWKGAENMRIFLETVVTPMVP